MWDAAEEIRSVDILLNVCIAIGLVGLAVLLLDLLRNRRRLTRKMPVITKAAIVVILTNLAVGTIGAYILAALHTSQYLLDERFLLQVAGGLVALFLAGWALFAKPEAGQDSGPQSES